MFQFNECCRDGKELQAKVHLNSYHQNNDRVTAGLQLHRLEREVAGCRIIFPRHTASMILITSKVGKWALKNSKVDLAAILHFCSNLALVNVKHVLRSQVLPGAREWADNVSIVLSNGVYIWVSNEATQQKFKTWYLVKMKCY